MIKSFSVENWRSFRKKATISMLATQEKQHSDRVSYLSGYDVRILPIASVYGGNASGKSNFFSALILLQTILVKGIEPQNTIPVDPFLLDINCATKTTNFEIEIVVNDIVYRYSLSLTRQEIIEESLIRVDYKCETALYKRKNQTIELETLEEAHKTFWKFIIDSKITRPNQTFLKTAIDLNFEPWLDIWNFFKTNLIIIFPGSKYIPIEKLIEENSDVNKRVNELLTNLDTGISRIGAENIDIKSYAFSSKERELISNLSDGYLLRFGQVIVRREKGNLVAKRLASYHQRVDDEEIHFGLDMESDGSKRALDILPAIIDLQSHKNVYVIDEIDRSLHTALTGTFIEEYLNSCSEKKRSQLLFTTHDTQLMTQDIFRRDEIWFTERQNDGSSELFSLGEFDIRADLDIRKNYLQGRFGGIPNIATYHRCR